MFGRIMRIVLSRTFAFSVLIILQIALFFALVLWLANYAALVYTLITVITALVLVLIMERDDVNPAYKLMWTLVMILMPVFGTFFYLLWGHRHVPRRRRRVLKSLDERLKQALVYDDSIIAGLQDKDAKLGQNALYLQSFANAPLYKATNIEYYDIGESFFPKFLDAIKAAKKYIFMQYYILEPGIMLDTTVDILVQKVREGVDVRILWDGFGSIFTMPREYAKRLKTSGIKCGVFEPLHFTPHISNYAMLNHRDHRKIAIIDGDVAFSGGLNFADEYINVKKRFGQWKDTAFKITGNAVYSLTTTFLSAWDYVAGTSSVFEDYKPQSFATNTCNAAAYEYVQPYFDSPLDSENVCENAYMNIIRHADNYVWISTPYLILDHEMITNLTLAAKSGVDIRILTPAIPDKPAVFFVTQSYYRVLLECGVRIYEYTPGFNHAKMYVSDDKAAIIGSANMDYRSLYLHFENCVAFYGGNIVASAKRDMQNSFEVSKEITMADIENIRFSRRMLQIAAKFFAPML